VPLVNGFCLLVTRSALDAVGLFDEKSFPRGFGEEDDFAIRALGAGFRHRIADDCYVYHAKSRSFTPEGRDEIVRETQPVLARKHGRGRLEDVVARARGNEDLLRARVAARLAATGALPLETTPLQLPKPVRIAWLQPHLDVVGGIRRTIEMTNRLVAWGFEVTLYTAEGRRTGWLPIAADVTQLTELGSRKSDCLIITDPDVVDPFLDANITFKINYHLHAYYLYRESSPQLEAYYRMDPSVVHIANSHWTAEQIADRFKVEAVIPGGVSRELFRPMRVSRTHDVGCYGSPRPRKGTAAIEEATRGLRLLRLSQVSRSQQDLAECLCRASVFVSASTIEGFNFCPLEAMACGVPVVTTDDGGNREYVVDGENALVVSEPDPALLRPAIEHLLSDSKLRLRLIERGMETAWRYTWDDATLQLAQLILGRLG
jgi:hypothetical protein